MLRQRRCHVHLYETLEHAQVDRVLLRAGELAPFVLWRANGRLRCWFWVVHRLIILLCEAVFPIWILCLITFFYSMS